MKKGFTLIEVIVSLMAFSIVAAALFKLNENAINTNNMTKNRDFEYNLSHIESERFKAEATPIENKTVIVYLNDITELHQSIADIVNFGYDTPLWSYQTISKNNTDKKSFGIIIYGYNSDYLNIIKVTTLSMANSDSGVTLKAMK